MTSRDRLLNRLRRHLRPTNHPAPWRSRRQFDDLAVRFTTALTAAGGDVVHVATLADARTAIFTLLDEIQAKRVALNDEPLLHQLALPEHAPRPIEWHIAGEKSEALRTFCAHADVGITAAAAALAETGTVVVQSGRGKSRLVSLLPPVHIAVLTTDQITTDLFTWVETMRPAEMPANLVFISGPSKTADIEQTLAIGVHGPKRFVVVLVDTPPEA
nr:lactate utilization protein [Ardenticatena sp.]